MQFQLLLLSSLAALASTASIQKRSDPWPPAVQDFFAEVGMEVRAVRAMKGSRAAVPACDLSAATLPSSSLPPPSEGLSVYHVAIGRGTQNYTCDPSNPLAAPTAIGATASLYNASCIAAQHPNVLARLPPAALAYPIPKRQEDTTLFPGDLMISGEHYFTDPKTPVFNLHTAAANYGIYFASKTDNTTAPEGAAKTAAGAAAVPWLKLSVLPPPADALEADTKGGVKEIYRVNTAGGSAPKTCEGQPAAIQIDYAAEYWFFA